MIDDSSSDIKIQRRNLIITSSLILFYELGGLSVNGEAHLPIINVAIKKPEVINSFLHGMAIYFLWRYFIAFEQAGGLKKRFQEIRHSAYAKMHSIAYKKTLSLLKQNVTPVPNVSFEGSNPVYTKTKNPLKLSASYNYAYHNNNHKRISGRMDLSLWKILLIGTSTIFSHFIKTGFFVEYFFPFFLFAICILESLDIHLLNGLINFLNW